MSMTRILKASLEIRKFLNKSVLTALGLTTSVTMCSGRSEVHAHDGMSDPIIQTMQSELKRTMDRLKIAGKAPLYYLAYRLYECPWDTISAANGALLNDTGGCLRMLSVDMRVGSPHFDNTHFLRLKNSAASQIYEYTRNQRNSIPCFPLQAQGCLWRKHSGSKATRHLKMLSSVTPSLLRITMSCRPRRINLTISHSSQS